MSYLGQQLGQGQAERFVFTASGSETSVTTADDGRAIAYTVGQVDVYLNGAKLVNGSDFTATTGTSITGLAALTASDVVEVFALSIFQASDTVSAASGGTFNGNVTVAANLSVTGTAAIAGSQPRLELQESDTTDLDVYLRLNGGDFTIETRTDAGVKVGDRIRAASNGDISFYEDTGTNAKLFWDSSAERLGIGTTSPSSVLHLSTSNDPIITLTDTGAGASADITGSNGNLRLNSQTATIFDMADSEVARINSSGRLGIGTTTINEKLVLGSADSGSNFLQVTNSTTTAADNRGFYVGIDANEAARILNRENTDMIFSTNNTEKLRIDTSGNLLVGSSAASPAAADATAVRYGIGVQAGSLSSVVALTAGTAADVINLTDVIDGSQNGAGMWLVSIVRDGGSYGTHFVGIFGANNTSIALYDTLQSNGLTITVSGTTIRANPTSATDNFNTNAIPLTVGG